MMIVTCHALELEVHKFRLFDSYCINRNCTSRHYIVNYVQDTRNYIHDLVQQIFKLYHVSMYGKRTLKSLRMRKSIIIRF